MKAFSHSQALVSKSLVLEGEIKKKKFKLEL